MVKCFVSGDLPFLPPYTWLIIVLKTGKVFQSCITLIEVRDHSAAGLKVNEIPWTSHFSKLSPQSSEGETRFWITKTAFPPPAWTPSALHSLAHCFPCFVRLCRSLLMKNHSVLDESCGYVLLLVIREQMGLFVWASLASSLAKLSLTFSLSPSYILVCASL